MSEKIDPLTPLGRRVLGEIKAREAGVPDSCDYQPTDPPELGWEPKPRLDFRYMQSLGHIAGNPFYEEPPDGAA